MRRLCSDEGWSTNLYSLDGQTVYHYEKSDSDGNRTACITIHYKLGTKTYWLQTWNPEKQLWREGIDIDLHTADLEVAKAKAILFL